LFVDLTGNIHFIGKQECKGPMASNSSMASHQHITACSGAKISIAKEIILNNQVNEM
jgi:hypothetical protein